MNITNDPLNINLVILVYSDDLLLSNEFKKGKIVKSEEFMICLRNCSVLKLLSRNNAKNKNNGSPMRPLLS